MMNDRSSQPESAMAIALSKFQITVIHKKSTFLTKDKSNKKLIDTILHNLRKETERASDQNMARTEARSD